jgi:multidrug efflux pump subunit AcrB
MPFFRAAKPVEIVLAILLSLVCILGLMGTLCALALGATGTDARDLAFAPLLLGPALAGAGGLVILWLRNRNELTWWMVLAATPLWFIGTLLMMSGLTASFLPNEPGEFLPNLGYSVALCMGPGAILALIGLGLLGYAYRRPWKAGAAQPQTTATTTGELDRAAKLRRAAEYRALIADLLNRKRSSTLVQQLPPVAGNLDQWMSKLRELSKRLDAFEANTVVQRDLRDLPLTIERLTARLQAETDAAVCAQIQETLSRYRDQQNQLAALASVMRRTELELDAAVASMGTLYSSLQLIDARELDSARAGRFQNEIQEQVNRLGDLLSAIDQVYRGPRSK